MRGCEDEATFPEALPEGERPAEARLRLEVGIASLAFQLTDEVLCRGEETTLGAGEISVEAQACRVATLGVSQRHIGDEAEVATPVRLQPVASPFIAKQEVEA